MLLSDLPFKRNNLPIKNMKAKNNTLSSGGILDFTLPQTNSQSFFYIFMLALLNLQNIPNNKFRIFLSHFELKVLVAIIDIKICISNYANFLPTILYFSPHYTLKYFLCHEIFSQNTMF